MTDSPMTLIRKLDETAASLLELAKHVRQSAPQIADDALRKEMMESAAGLERRAQDMAEAIRQLRMKIN